MFTFCLSLYTKSSLAQQPPKTQAFCYNIFMNDIIKDPIQPGANPTPTPTKSNNNTLIIVIVVVACVFFLLPMLFVFIIARTFSNYLDDFAYEFDDSYYDSSYQAYNLSAEETKSFQSVWLATQDETIAQRGVSYKDCMSVVGSSWGFYYANQHVFDDFGWHDDVICNETLKVKSEIKDEANVLYISDGKNCSSYTLNEDFDRLLEFSKYFGQNQVCTDMISVPLVLDSADEGDEIVPDNTTNDTGTTPTSRT